MINLELSQEEASSLYLILEKADILISWELNDQYDLWNPVINAVQEKIEAALERSETP